MRLAPMSRHLAAGLGLALAAAWSYPAAAQSASEKATPLVGQSQKQTKQYDDEELKAFAVAALEVQRIRRHYIPRVQTAKSPQERQEINEQATGEMIDAIERRGLSAKKYDEIYTASQQDPALASRIEEHLQEAQ